MFKGNSLSIEQHDDGVLEIRFDHQAGQVNTLDSVTLDELKQAVNLIKDKKIKNSEDVKGVIVTSAKDSFIVGANIYEFPQLFASGADKISAHNSQSNDIVTAFEDLAVPTVVVLNGLALGGGFELAMAADYRVAAKQSRAGLPEVGLGIFPGLGGTVRLPRLVGAAKAVEWIISGQQLDAQTLLDAGAVDAVVDNSNDETSGTGHNPLFNEAMNLLNKVIADMSWVARRQSKLEAVQREVNEQALSALKAKAAARGTHYPAALAVSKLIEQSVHLSRDDALDAENKVFSGIASTPTAQALVQLFINDQLLKKKARQYSKTASKVEQAGVLGAGIMGGGIAFTSAVRGTPVIMKDIAQTALDAGMAEVNSLLNKQLKTGRIDAIKAEQVLQGIIPTLDFDRFNEISFLVEAIVENLDIKKKVLADVETRVSDSTILASNTSSLSIADLATALKRPQNFVGMHFFNPVPVMPLVEIIQGPSSSVQAAAIAASYAVAMGKTPVVVKDCPGFLVNRILTTQSVGFIKLIEDGADFVQIDRVMEAFGWPMGPAYLQDVIGMDTSSHVVDEITAGYPERMQVGKQHVLALMAEHKRYGQKNNIGFYRYEKDERGRPQKLMAEDTAALIATIQPNGQHEFSDQEMLDRLMLPMVIEAALCLEEGIASTAAEIDMSMILGAGFPRHWGGPLKYADMVGLDNIVSRCKAYTELGGAYVPTERMQEMAKRGERFHQLS